MRRRLLPLLPAAVTLLLGAAADPGPIRDRIIADARLVNPAALAFERHTHVVQVGGGKRSEQRRVERWDGRRWSLVSIDGKPPSPADLKSAAKANVAQPVPGYHRLASLLASAAATRTDAGGATVLTVPVLPAGTAFADGTDISSHLRAEAFVVTTDGNPWVQRLRLTAREPFKLSWLLKVTTFEQVSEYSREGGGSPRLASQVADSQGTMFGFAGGQKSEVTYAYR